MNQAMKNKQGFRCPVRGCDKKKNRLFGALGIAQHLLDKHPGEFERRLRIKKVYIGD